LIYNKPTNKVTKAERKASKAITLGLLYGGSPAGLAQRSGLSIPTVRSVIVELFNHYPGLERSIIESQENALSAGMITSPFGRVRDLKAIILKYGERDAARKAINTPIQSAASDVGLVIMYNCNHRIEEFGLNSTVTFGVHDSVLTDIYPGEKGLVTEYVQESFRLLHKTPLAKYRLFSKLPITGQLVLGKCWAEVEDTNEFYNPTDIIDCSSI